MAIRTETDMPNDAGLPTDAGLDQQVSLIGPITQHFDVADMCDASNLRGGVLQQSLVGVSFADDTSKGRECTLVIQGFLRIEHDSPFSLHKQNAPPGEFTPMTGSPIFPIQRPVRNTVPDRPGYPEPPGNLTPAGRDVGFEVRAWGDPDRLDVRKGVDDPQDTAGSGLLHK